MASYKSSRLNPPRREEQTPQAHRTVPTRLPQRSVTPTITASHQASSTHSKLQKRNPNKDEQMYPSRGFSSQRGTAAKAFTTAPSRQERTAGLIGPVSSSQSKPSMSKKTTAQATSSRLPKLEVPRTVITPTPSLISGSSVSTTDSPRSGLLRKKQSSIGPKSRTREDSVTPLEERQPIKQSFAQFKDPFSETVLGITIPPSSSIMAPIQVEAEFPYNYELGPTDIMVPALPQYAPSTTPSTGYSESPSLFSISSTPTSMSSYSPGVAFPGKHAPRMRQASPLSGKPPIGRLAAPEEHGLSAVRESTRSLTSTSLAQTEPQAEKPVVTRRPSETIGDKPRVQAPPEFAHLADSSAGRRPSRPSREGTSDITALRGPSPIIQSNLSSFPSSHRRIPSTGSVTGATNNGKGRFGIPSKSSSRNPSPNPSLASGFAPPSRVPTRGTTPELEKQRSQTLPSSAPSPSKSSRFGFFTRRTKTESSATKPEKKHRRGPAAGTGHEGYGRYAVRGRSGSMGSVAASIGRSASAATTSESLDRTPSTRKSSVTSTSSTEMDDFLLNRLVPRVIRGNGSTNSLTRSPEPMGSTTSLTASSSQNEKPTPQDLEIARPALLPSAMSDPVRSMSPIKKPVLGFRRTSESDDDSKRSFIPSLASKRTSYLSKIVDAPSASRVPTSENALVKGRTGSTDGYASEGKEGNWLKNSKQGKTEKELNKPRKWNFFQRAHAAPRVATPAVETVSPARAPVSRSVAHYALASEAEVNLDDLEQLIEDDSSPESELARTGVLGIPSPIGTPEVKERLQSMLLPPKPILPADFSVAARPASPKVFLHAEPEVEAQPSKLSVETSLGQKSQISDSNVPADLTPVTDLSPCSSPSRPSSPVESLISPKTTPAPLPLFSSQVHSPPPGPPPSHLPPKPSRLAQVGRIPQVVSSRNNMHRSSQSFSRPFAVNQPRPFSPPRTSFDSFGSISATSHPTESFPVLQGLDAITHASAMASLSPSVEETTRQSEFFKFPLRKDSEVSYSSSSGTWSFPATAGTAVIPVTGAPQSEDEVWNEYDDLIDEVLSPAESDAKEKSTRTRSSLEPLPLNVKTDPNHPSYHLRRSRLLSVLHAQSPTSPISLSDFLQGCGDKTISVVDPVTGRLSFPSTTRMSIGSTPRNRASSTRSSLPASLTLSARQSKATLASSSDKDRESTSANKYRDSRLREFAEAQGDGIVSMANLRFGALMTSKWLSFGRVLFSPAHFELKNPNEDRVLVIDGLGKDWSYYCALTYPEATIYNLGPGASSSPQANSNTASEPWSTLANHRHINHASPRTAFPFPKGFFACVVLRFPSALPSSVHRFVVSECKRVLRPGGHLELSVLDLDLVNMGNRARRAVRGLKVKMQVADVDTSLRNMSDEIIGLLGRKGFTECNRCFVGVPVAGQLPGPDDSSSAPLQGSRKGSTASSVHNPPSSKQVKTTPAPKPELSFSELLDMQTSSDDSKENGIADMVARVGRWWYSRCYESVVLPEAGEPGAAASGTMFETSMWRDEALVSECEKRGTSFRLLIGYAQKPEVGVRRTVSV